MQTLIKSNIFGELRKLRKGGKVQKRERNSLKMSYTIIIIEITLDVVCQAQYTLYMPEKLCQCCPIIMFSMASPEITIKSK